MLAPGVALLFLSSLHQGGGGALASACSALLLAWLMWQGGGGWVLVRVLALAVGTPPHTRWVEPEVTGGGVGGI